MVAKDFITNVTAVFPSASARVVPNENDRTKSKYTMKGISPRAVPIDLRNRALVPCQWRTPVTQSTEGPSPAANCDEPPYKECDIWFSPTGAEEMWTHIIEHHLEVPRDRDNPRKFSDGKLDGSGRKFACLWADCTRHPPPGSSDAFAVCMHMKTHVPDANPMATTRAKRAWEQMKSAKPRKLEHSYLNTPVDSDGNPTGLPLISMLVLRNLARQMLKLEASDMRGKQNLIERHFALHQERICHVMTFNYSLRAYTPELVQFVSKGMNMAHKLPRMANGSAD
jgi:chromatin structure-remodeling complex subunit RSC9